MKINITGLHPKQVEIVKDIISSTDSYFAINASRQSGKTFLIARLVVYLALEKKCKILFIGPETVHTQEIFDKIMEMSNIQTILSRKPTISPGRMLISFINGSLIKFRAVNKNPDNVRGGSYEYVFFDEFAFVKQGILAKVKPAQNAKKNAKMIFTSTPNGRNNEFYDIWHRGYNLDINKYKDMEKFKTRSYFMHYSDNPMTDLEKIEIDRLSTTDLMFRQEYNGEFVEGEGSVFKNLDNFCVNNSYPEYDQHKRYYGGIDFGRVNDSSVLTIVDQNGVVQVVYSITNMEYPQQLQYLIPILQQYKCVVLAENNGNGVAAVDELIRKYPDTIKFTTSNTSKNDIIESLIRAINTDKFVAPSKKLCPVLYSELESFEIQLNPIRRTVFYAARNGCHDDHVISVSLANYCREKYSNAYRGLGFSTYINPNRF